MNILEKLYFRDREFYDTVYIGNQPLISFDIMYLVLKSFNDNNFDIHILDHPAVNIIDGDFEEAKYNLVPSFSSVGLDMDFINKEKLLLCKTYAIEIDESKDVYKSKINDFVKNLDNSKPIYLYSISYFDYDDEFNPKIKLRFTQDFKTDFS